MTSAERHALIEKHVPQDEMKLVLRLITDAYRQEHRETYERFAPQFGRTALPQTRRPLIDQSLAVLAGRDDLKMRAEVAKNAGENCYHTRLWFGPIVITQSCVRSEREVVRHAVYRQHYAEDCQPELEFTDDDRLHAERSPVVTGELYGILLHRPNRRSAKIPDMFVIQFPNKACTAYMGDPINLLGWFPDIATSLRQDLEEIISRPKVYPVQLPQKKRA